MCIRLNNCFKTTEVLLPVPQFYVLTFDQLAISESFKLYSLHSFLMLWGSNSLGFHLISWFFVQRYNCINILKYSLGVNLISWNPSEVQIFLEIVEFFVGYISQGYTTPLMVLSLCILDVHDEAEKEELRPLYLDAQATTPLVTIYYFKELLEVIAKSNVWFFSAPPFGGSVV